MIGLNRGFHRTDDRAFDQRYGNDREYRHKYRNHRKTDPQVSCNKVFGSGMSDVNRFVNAFPLRPNAVKNAVFAEFDKQHPEKLADPVVRIHPNHIRIHKERLIEAHRPGGFFGSANDQLTCLLSLVQNIGRDGAAGRIFIGGQLKRPVGAVIGKLRHLFQLGLLLGQIEEFGRFARLQRIAHSDADFQQQIARCLFAHADHFVNGFSAELIQALTKLFRHGRQ